jgi:hypothetical protein
VLDIVRLDASAEGKINPGSIACRACGNYGFQMSIVCNKEEMELKNGIVQS